jgi:predicted HTH domain antitoxin
MRLTIEYPEELLDSTDAQEPEALAQETLLVKLHALGKLSSGRAAEILGISRRAFLDLLDRNGISVFDDETDLEAEAARG